LEAADKPGAAAASVGGKGDAAGQDRGELAAATGGRASATWPGACPLEGKVCTVRKVNKYGSIIPYLVIKGAVARIFLLTIIL
jgi:hypothetical protein